MKPVRTCVGCRGRDNKTDLVRLVAADAGIQVDLRQIAPGRGAYLHRDRECWEQAYRRRTLSRVLRTPALERSQLLDAWDRLHSDRGAA